MGEDPKFVLKRQPLGWGKYVPANEAGNDNAPATVVPTQIDGQEFGLNRAIKEGRLRGRVFNPKP